MRREEFDNAKMRKCDNAKMRKCDNATMRLCDCAMMRNTKTPLGEVFSKVLV